MSFSEIGKLLIGAGIFFLILGAGLLFLGKFNFQGLPGDIVIKKENFSFYFPITSCLVISLLISLLMRLFSGR